MESDCLMGMKCYSWVTKSFETRKKWMLHNIVNVRITLFFKLVVCYTHFSSITKKLHVNSIN